MSLTRRYETDLLAHIDRDRPVEVSQSHRIRSYKNLACAAFVLVAMVQVAALRLPGRMAVEQVARWPWNAWPDERGLGGRMVWNPQPVSFV